MMVICALLKCLTVILEWINMSRTCQRRLSVSLNKNPEDSVNIQPKCYYLDFNIVKTWDLKGCIAIYNSYKKFNRQ